MRRPLVLILIVCALIYLASPYYTMWRLNRAIDSGDTYALEKLVDWPRIRDQLRGEMLAVFNAAMEGEDSLSQGLGAALAPAFIGQLVDGQITAAALAASGREGRSVFAADKHRLTYAFFTGPTTFRVDFEGSAPTSGETLPLGVYLELQGLGWRVTHLDFSREQMLAALRKDLPPSEPQTSIPSSKVDRQPAFECEVENWKFSGLGSRHTKLEGTTSCDSGKMVIKAFDENGNYLGNATAYIEAGAWDALIGSPAPSQLKIQYSISAR